MPFIVPVLLRLHVDSRPVGALAPQGQLLSPLAQPCRSVDFPEPAVVGSVVWWSLHQFVLAVLLEQPWSRPELLRSLRWGLARRLLRPLVTFLVHLAVAVAHL